MALPSSQEIFDVRAWVADALGRDRVEVHLLRLPPDSLAPDRFADNTHAYLIGGSVCATVTETMVQVRNTVLCRLLELQIRGQPEDRALRLELPPDRATRF